MIDDAAPQPALRSATDPALKRAARAAAYVFWIMFLINFLNYFDRYIFLGLETSIKSSLHLTDFDLGNAVGAFLLVYTIVALPLGFIADRIARKTVVAVGVAVWSVASFATGLASSALSLIGIRAFLGIGEGSYYPSGTPMLAAHYPPARRPSIFGRWTVGALIGAAVGFLAASFFESSKVNGVTVDADLWRSAFYFTGVPGLILAVLLWFSREKTRHEDDPPADHLASEGNRRSREFVPTSASRQSAPSSACRHWASSPPPEQPHSLSSTLEIPMYRVLHTSPMPASHLSSSRFSRGLSSCSAASSAPSSAARSRTG